MQPTTPRRTDARLGRGHDAHHLCTTCCGLRSTDVFDAHDRHRFVDRCDCEPRPNQDAVASSEARIPCALCATCGLTVVQGHSRWHLHHCPGCAPLVTTLNRTAGRLVVPIGIHSLVNGVALNAARAAHPTNASDTSTITAEDDAQILAFADQFAAVTRSIGDLREHRRALVRHHLAVAGLDHLGVVDLERYFAACRDAGIDARIGWNALLQRVLTDRDPFDGDTDPDLLTLPVAP